MHRCILKMPYWLCTDCQLFLRASFYCYGHRRLQQAPFCLSASGLWFSCVYLIGSALRWQPASIAVEVSHMKCGWVLNCRPVVLTSHLH
eukprot:jgi/Botrbrau1/10331/Bobra.0321s0009.1